jgi:hypothetical protein
VYRSRSRMSRGVPALMGRNHLIYQGHSYQKQTARRPTKPSSSFHYRSFTFGLTSQIFRYS